MSIDETPSSAFWDRVARRYAAMSMRNPAAWETTLERVQAHMGPQDRVLELGCGTGSTALRLAPLAEQYIATDYSAEMIAIAREKQAGTDLENLDFRVAKIGNDDLPEGPFDAVIAFNVLHLLPDRQLALREIFDLLSPGGLLISKTPCLGGVYRLLQPVVAALQLFGKAPKLEFLKPVSLEREISDAGFEILECGDYPARPPSHFIVTRKMCFV